MIFGLHEVLEVAADLAEIMEELDRHQREVLFKRLDVETAAEALEERIRAADVAGLQRPDKLPPEAQAALASASIPTP